MLNSIDVLYISHNQFNRQITDRRDTEDVWISRHVLRIRPKRDIKRFKKCGRKKFFYSDCIPINLLIVQLFRKQNQHVNDPFRINDFSRVFLQLQLQSNRNDDKFLEQIQW